MTHILDHDRCQLLPKVIDDYVCADDPVQFIEAFVAGLRLRGSARNSERHTEDA
jgi:hypothetical protein